METIFNEVLNQEHTLNPTHGKIITIEGIDGAGKTTIIDNCVKTLNNKGYKATHFFTSSDFNIYWDMVKRGINHDCIDKETNQILHNIAFLSYINSVFIKLLNEYDYVLSEWYIYGKMVLSELYIDKKYNKALELLKKELATGNIPLPDYSFFIDTNPYIVKERIIKRNSISETKEQIDMLIKAYTIWNYYINNYNIEKIDGTLSIDKITNKVLKKVLTSENKLV